MEKMKFLKNKAVIGLFVAGAAATTGFFSAKFLGNDSIPEELSEKVIEKVTGVKLDFSPEQ